MAYLEFRVPDQTAHRLPLTMHGDRISYLSIGTDQIARIDQTDGRGALAIITLAKGRWVLLTPKGRSLSVNGRTVAPLKVLTHNDQIGLGGLTLRFCAETIETLDADSPILKRRCPYTQELFKVGDRIVRCPDCHTPHSVMAWFEYRACGHLHCSYQAQIEASDTEEESANGG